MPSLERRWSCLLYTSIINEDSVTEIDKVLDIVSEETVTIKVTVPKNIRENLTKDSFTVIADMENLNGMNTVPLTVTCSNPAVTWANIHAKLALLFLLQLYLQSSRNNLHIRPCDGRIRCV